jgi:protein-S-isoprenylcysteine O-methyltransferase Ste14
MSHRTRELEPLTGFSRVVRELRYHEATRQSLAVILILLYALTAKPLTVVVAVALPVALLGTAVRLYASGFIMKNRELATGGPYAVVRHPLYTGNILLILGFAAANANWWALPLAALFFWFYYPTAIEYEDRKLRRLFAAQWDRWAQDTPALIPSLRKVRHVASGNWSLAKSLRQNGEIFIAIYIVFCMGLILAKLD